MAATGDTQEKLSSPQVRRAFLFFPALIWASCWSCLRGVYPATQHLLLALLALSVVMGAAAFLDRPIRFRPLIVFPFLIPLGLSQLVRLGPEYLICTALLFAGALTALVNIRRNPWFGSVACSLLFNGVIAALLISVTPLVDRMWISFRYQTGIAGPMAALLLRIISPDVQLLPSGHVLTGGADRLSTFAISFESLAFDVALPFLVIAFLACLVRLLPWRAFLAGTILMFGLSVFRFVTLSLLYLEIDTMDIFWQPVPSLLFFAPVALYWGRNASGIGLLETSPSPEKGNPADSSSARISLGLFVGVFLASFALSWCPRGDSKSGRVMFDEYHSGWERTDRVMTTQWYGKLSSYNYSDMYRHLGEYYEVGRLLEPIDSHSLSQTDVLVIKTPTKPYSEEELDAIEQFVAHGGGLWLIGDHTNILGMTTYINPIADRFGLQYGYDAVYDIMGGMLQQQFWKTILRHPITAPMPDFLWGTSTTLSADLLTEFAMIGSRTRVAHVDYGRESFFGESHITPDMKHGQILQLGVREFDKGRVVAFTDSTVLSNFWYFFPGKCEMAVATIQWLNQTNAVLPRATKIAMGLLGILLSWACVRRLKVAEHLILGTLVLLVAQQLGYGAAAWSNARTGLLPLPQRPAPRVYVYCPGSDVELPIISMPDKNSYHTWVLAFQRQQIDPVPIANLARLDEIPGPLFVVNPYAKEKAPLTYLSDAVVDDIVNRCKQGLDLVIILSNSEPGFLSPVLGEVGLSAFPKKEEDALLTPQGALVKYPEPLYLNGECAPLLRSQKGFIVAGRAPLGNGSVTVVTIGSLVRDMRLGLSNSNPNPEQRAIFDLIYLLNQAIVGTGAQGTHSVNNDGS